ncbi:NEDD4 family-interacting protein 1-like [Watersipora subatra]|uniref:NEDD4 family-interacting protein 1-like n=1 Tax=Watersipora subatra TaxID=2589382 RepID=UPI00355AEBF1
MEEGATASTPLMVPDSTETSESTSVEVVPPPAYEDEVSRAATVPPAYDVASKLPTYDEAEKCKAAEAGLPVQEECSDRAARQARRTRAHGFSFLFGGPAMLIPEREESAPPSNMSHAQLQRQVLGTELEFLCCFFVALLFNWIGLFAALCCLTATIAGRAGAIAGFGLSVIKWAFLVMHQTYITETAWGFNTTDSPITFLRDTTDDNVVLSNSQWFTVSCWLIAGLGFLCFLQGIVHYVKAKRCARDYNWLRQRYQPQPF